MNLPSFSDWKGFDQHDCRNNNGTKLEPAAARTKSCILPAARCHGNVNQLRRLNASFTLVWQRRGFTRCHLSHFQLFLNSPQTTWGHVCFPGFHWEQQGASRLQSAASVLLKGSWVPAGGRLPFHSLALNHPESSLGFQLSNSGGHRRFFKFVKIFLSSEICLIQISQQTEDL